MEICNGSLIKTGQLDVRIDGIISQPVCKTSHLKNHTPCDEVFVSDSSDLKAIAYSLEGGPKVQLQYTFTEEERKWSSSARETLAVLMTLRQFKAKGLTQRNIYWATDSEVMTVVLKKGSHRPMLQKLIFEVVKLCSELSIRVEPIHLRRMDPRIQVADELSKQKDTDNWSIDEWSFQTLNAVFAFHFDLFANKVNRKTELYFSKYFEEESQGIDAFSQSWENLGMLWICPPVSDLIKVHKRILSTSCRGVLIMPKWVTSSFIHCFVGEGNIIKDPYKLVSEFNPYVVQNEGATNTALFGVTQFQFLALSFGV